MSQLPTSQLSVAQALNLLRAEDERVATDAEAALNSLTWDEGLETITQYGLQHFLWFELPVKWIVDLDTKRHLAAALGRLLGLVGLPRYAALCHAKETRDILAVYERGDRDGLAAFHKAQERSGVDPPDLPELRWGSVVGHEETSALLSVATHLELAITAGEFQPGARGWRAAQQSVAREYLSSPRPELDEDTWLEAVRAERITAWARSHGQTRRELVAPLVGRVARPVPFPDGADEVVAPLRWLLGRAASDTGVPLTQKGNLARPLVLEAVEQMAAGAPPERWLTTFGRWRSDRVAGPPRRRLAR